MTFSIVIPTYNGKMFVEAAISSALSQTRPADEIIISDDNSSDLTLDICEKYSHKIKIFKNPTGPSGFVNGWNNAISHASGDFISILHQDDVLDPTFLEEIEKAVKANPDVKHFFTPCASIDAEGNITRSPDNLCSGIAYRYNGQEYSDAYIRTPGHIHRCPGVVTHRDIFKVCKYREEAGHIADNDFFIRVGNYTDVVGVLKPLAFYREHDSSETGHLSFFKLNKRLLDDYHFQLAHKNDNPLMSDFITETFKRWEAEYIHRLTIFGLKKGKFKYALNAIGKWLSWDSRFGNMRYDLHKIPCIFKTKIKKIRVAQIKRKAQNAPELKINKPILILAPHPDDEVLGCGGLVARLCKEGNPPHVAILTGGGGSLRGHSAIPESEVIKARRQLTLNSAHELGLPKTNIHFLDFIDGKISAQPQEEIEKLGTLISKLKPSVIFVPHSGEGWPDHLAVREIGIKLAPESATVYEYCVWMWYYNVWRLDWKNARSLKMTKEEHEAKLRAVEAYVKPLAPIGAPWSGILPKPFLRANTSDIELYFKLL